MLLSYWGYFRTARSTLPFAKLLADILTCTTGLSSILPI
jgi:hypothetical protein